MGILGGTLSALGGNVHGVKPRPFLKYEFEGKLPTFGHNELVEDLHTQKRRMAELSNAFIVLPGGFGTLEELMAIRMWIKLGQYTRKEANDSDCTLLGVFCETDFSPLEACARSLSFYSTSTGFSIRSCSGSRLPTRPVSFHTTAPR
jgi:hypothetical protein